MNIFNHRYYCSNILVGHQKRRGVQYFSLRSTALYSLMVPSSMVDLIWHEVSWRFGFAIDWNWMKCKTTTTMSLAAARRSYFLDRRSGGSYYKQSVNQIAESMGEKTTVRPRPELSTALRSHRTLVRCQEETTCPMVVNAGTVLKRWARVIKRRSQVVSCCCGCKGDAKLYCI